MARNVYPSWLIVEYASTFLMSFWATAMVAISRAVPTPTQAMRSGTQSLDAAMTGFTRIIRKTPAVTIVAAWIRADTGVGPAMASGNQTNSGNCADLPMAPMNSSTAMAVAVVVAMVAASSLSTA